MAEKKHRVGYGVVTKEGLMKQLRCDKERRGSLTEIGEALHRQLEKDHTKRLTEESNGD